MVDWKYHIKTVGLSLLAFLYIVAVVVLPIVIPVVLIVWVLRGMGVIP